MTQETTEGMYRVNLPAFEGPLDLLLYLIKRDELDIWDIPIARITEEYLSYLDLMSELNLSVAGEFLLMASMLAAIKSRMLVAAQEEADEDLEVDDPRTPLVERLLEYQRYREAAAQLSRRACLNRDVFERGMPAFENTGEAPVTIADVSLYDLMAALKAIIARAKSSTLTHQVTATRVSVVARIHWLHGKLRKSGSVSFLNLFGTLETRQEIIVTFLALLEMLKANIIRLEVLDVSEGGQGHDIPTWKQGATGNRDWAITERLPGKDLPETFVTDW